MVVVNSDDEEERKHLLSQDSSPLKVPNGDNVEENQLLPRYLVLIYWQCRDFPRPGCFKPFIPIYPGYFDKQVQ